MVDSDVSEAPLPTPGNDMSAEYCQQNQAEAEDVTREPASSDSSTSVDGATKPESSKLVDNTAKPRAEASASPGEAGQESFAQLLPSEHQQQDQQQQPQQQQSKGLRRRRQPQLDPPVMASTSGPNSYDLNDPSSVPYHIATMNLAPGEHPSLLTRRMGQASSSVAPLVVKIPSSASRSPVVLTPKRVKKNSAPNTPTTPVSAPPVMPTARHKISCPSPIMRVIFEDCHISSQSAGISPCKCLRERIEANTKPGGGVIEWACSGESPHTTTCFP